MSPLRALRNLLWLLVVTRLLSINRIRLWLSLVTKGKLDASKDNYGQLMTGNSFPWGFVLLTLEDVGARSLGRYMARISPCQGLGR
jgi:hypothetical protein